MNEIKEVVNNNSSESSNLFNGSTPMGNIVVEGISTKNIYDGEYEVGGYSDTTGGKIISATRYRNTNPIPVKPNTTYVFSINGTKYTSNIGYFFYRSDGTFLFYEASATGIITTPNNCYYMCFHSTSLKTDYPAGLSKVQIEKGSTATQYAPYMSFNGGGQDIVVVDDLTHNTFVDNEVLSAHQGYILNQKFNYSTSEVEIGKWRDGKTLYRKCYTITNTEINVGSWTTLEDVTSLNIDTLVDCRLYNNKMVWSGFLTRINNGDLQVINGMRDGLSWPCNEFIIEYTKS